MKTVHISSLLEPVGVRNFNFVHNTGIVNKDNFHLQNSVKFNLTIKFEISIIIERIAIKKILSRLDILLIADEI